MWGKNALIVGLSLRMGALFALLLAVPAFGDEYYIKFTDVSDEEGKFYVIEQLSWGPTSDVHRVRGPDGKYYALRVYKQSDTAAQRQVLDAIARLKQVQMGENRAPSNLMQFHRGGEIGYLRSKKLPKFAVLMDLPSGPNVDRLITDKPFSVTEAYILANDLVAAARELQSVGLKHDNPTASNFIYDDGRFKLAELSAAISINGPHQRSAVDPGFAAPEAPVGADLYSQAATVYYSIFGESPLETVRVKLSAIRNADVSLDTVRRELEKNDATRKLYARAIKEKLAGHLEKLPEAEKAMAQSIADFLTTTLLETPERRAADFPKVLVAFEGNAGEVEKLREMVKDSLSSWRSQPRDSPANTKSEGVAGGQGQRSAYPVSKVLEQVNSALDDLGLFGRIEIDGLHKALMVAGHGLWVKALKDASVADQIKAYQLLLLLQSPPSSTNSRVGIQNDLTEILATHRFRDGVYLQIAKFVGQLPNNSQRLLRDALRQAKRGIGESPWGKFLGPTPLDYLWPHTVFRRRSAHEGREERNHRLRSLRAFEVELRHHRQAASETTAGGCAGVWARLTNRTAGY